MKQPVATLQHLAPAVGLQHVTLNEFQPILKAELRGVRSNMIGFGGVVEVANRPTNAVAVLQQISDDVVANVAVDARNEDSLTRLTLHRPREGRVPYEPSSATHRTEN